MKSSPSNKQWINQDTDNLFRAVLSLDDLPAARNFFRDLLTVPEIREFSKRWQAAMMLSTGRPYTEIVEITGLSSTTVARVAKFLNGPYGGYKKMIENKKYVKDATPKK